MSEAQRHGLPYGTHYLLEMAFFNGAKRGLDSAHAATDINSDRIGNNDPVSCQDTSDRHAETKMGVGHDGDMVEGERKIGKIFGLLQSAIFHIVKPELDRNLFAVQSSYHIVADVKERKGYQKP